MKKKDEKNCFIETVKEIKKNPDSFLLCHGIVEGTGELEGERFPYAWIEDGDSAIDVINNISLPTNLYYSLGRIDLVKKYTINEVNKYLKETGNYGPWDENILNYNEGE